MSIDTNTADSTDMQSEKISRNEPRDRRIGPAARRLRRFADLTGLDFACAELSTGEVLVRTDPDSLVVLPDEAIESFRDLKKAAVVEMPSGLVVYALPLPEVDDRNVVAAGNALARPDCRPQELVLAAAEENWSQAHLDHYVSQLPHASPRILRTLLEAAMHHSTHERLEDELTDEIEQLSEHLQSTFEEISLLHTLTRNLQISRGPVELAEMCLSRMHGLIRSAGNVIWIEEKNGTPHLLVQGRIPFDDIGMARLVSRFEDHDWSRPLVKNRIAGSLLGSDFPGLNNLVIVPISEGAHRSGWILSCNLSEGREYGTVEASLLNSVATILGTHLHNIVLYEEHDQLLLSFVRSLVSTLDAKDPYTRGHSDRVALLARRLGEELKLPEEDLYDIYLSGLLHDIGKIGVNDQILQKPGKLSDEEFKEIQKHPMIGYEILRGLKNLQNVLPGVRSHHENYNGKGYPDGLLGEEIPFMARILAVADSYDAMGSDRPYREGMPLERIEHIFRQGAGEQWDPRVIDAYFAAADEIRRISLDYTPSNCELLIRQGTEEFDAADVLL